MSARLVIMVSLAIVAALAIAAVVVVRQPDSPALMNAILRPSPKPATDATHKMIPARDVPGAASEFTFSADVPKTWQAEAVAATEAISFYDPTAPGATNLEKSQIFIRHFTASDFLTLSTVTIHSRTPLTLGGRPAVRYDIAKKPSVANFSSQPAWRSGRHIVTDVRVSAPNPSVFYVIAKRPDLADETYEAFLQSLHVNGENTSLLEPVAEFRERITKKPFGIYITPDHSPVSPERFTGYHTGVDVEYADVAGDVVVRAVAPGTVRVAKAAQGYGGVVAIEHEINNEKISAIYGHLAPSSLPRVGTSVAAGDTIGRLGAGGTAETDGERKHLHFAILATAAIDLRGYVPTQPELSAWRDPQELFS